MAERMRGRIGRSAWVAGPVCLGALAAGALTGQHLRLIAVAAVGLTCTLLVLTHPSFVAAVRARLRLAIGQCRSAYDPAAAMPVTLFLPAHAPLPAMTTLDLCVAWERSSRALDRLKRRGTIHAQSQVVLARQHYLDELERRNPHGFARWLRDGEPGSVVSPNRYLLSPPR